MTLATRVQRLEELVTDPTGEVWKPWRIVYSHDDGTVTDDETGRRMPEDQFTAEFAGYRFIVVGGLEEPI